MSRLCIVKYLYWEIWQKSGIKKDKYLECKDCPMKNCKEREKNGSD